MPYTDVLNLPRTDSNHHLVLVQCLGSQSHIPRMRNFRFEEAWMNHLNFVKVMKESWKYERNDIAESLQNLATNLSKWSQESFGNIYRRKKRLVARLKGI